MLSLAKNISTAFFLFASTTIAHAEILETDFLNVGDKLVLSDTATNLDFLKLTQTRGLSISEVQESLKSIYLGWRFASVAETVSFLNNLFLDDLASKGGYSAVPASGQWVSNIYIADENELVGWKSYVNTRKISYGLVYGNEGTSSLFGFYSDSASSSGGGFYRAYSSYSDVYTSQYYSTWLVRDENYIANVNAPLVISSLALFVLGFARSKKRYKRNCHT